MTLVKRGVKGSPVSAAEYDAVVDQVETNKDSIETLESQINSSEVQRSFVNRAAATTFYNDEVTAGRTPGNGILILLETEKEIHKWDSAEATHKTTYVKDDIEVKTTFDKTDNVSTSTDKAIYDGVQAELFEDTPTAGSTKAVQSDWFFKNVQEKPDITLDFLNPLNFQDNKKIIESNPTITDDAANATRVAIIEVTANETVKISTSLNKSSSAGFSNVIIGDDNVNFTSPTIILNANDLPDAVGTITLTDYEITIPAGITHIAIPNRKTSPFRFSRKGTLTAFTDKKITDAITEAEKFLFDENLIETRNFIDNYRIIQNTLTGKDDVNENTRTSKFIKVIPGDTVKITASLWKSTSAGFSEVVVGYEDLNKTNPVILINGNDVAGSTGQANAIVDKEVTIPSNINYIRIPDRKSNAFAVERKVLLEGKIASELQAKNQDTATLKFDKINNFYGTFDNPITTDLTIDLTNSINGSCSAVIFSGNAIPLITGATVQKTVGDIASQGIYTLYFNLIDNRVNLNIV